MDDFGNNVLHIIINILNDLQIFNMNIISLFIYLFVYKYYFATISYGFFLMSLWFIPSNMYLIIDLLFFSKFSIHQLINNLSYNMILNNYDYKKAKEFMLMMTNVYNRLYHQFQDIGDHFLGRKNLTKEQRKILDDAIGINLNIISNNIVNNLTMLKSIKYITNDDKIEIDREFGAA